MSKKSGISGMVLEINGTQECLSLLKLRFCRRSVDLIPSACCTYSCHDCQVGEEMVALSMAISKIVKDGFSAHGMPL